jgi:hypothetical protein
MRCFGGGVRGGVEDGWPAVRLLRVGGGVADEGLHAFEERLLPAGERIVGGGGFSVFDEINRPCPD